MEVGGVNGTAAPCVCVSAAGEVYTWGDNDEGQLGDGTTNAIQRPRLVAALQGKKINRVACGSAHTLAWSTSKPTNTGKLPAQVSSKGGRWAVCSVPPPPNFLELTGPSGPLKVPMEYNHLQEISIMALRNRLLLLHHISELFCPCIPMFDLEGRLGQTGHGPSVGFDTLRGILISQGKVRSNGGRRRTRPPLLRSSQSFFPVPSEQEAAFRKVVQATMVRDRQHGPVVELNRIQVRQKRSCPVSCGLPLPLGGGIQTRALHVKSFISGFLCAPACRL